jgi:type III secretion protein T
MESTAFAEALQKFYVYVLATGLAMARITPILMIVPVFTRMGLAGMVRGGVALALGVPLVPMIVAALGPRLPPFADLAPLIVKEPLIGVIIALVLGVPFWAAEAAGDTLDYQRATAFAGIVDPASSTQQSITGAFLSVAIVGLFFVSGGLDILLGVIYDSYAIWPPTQVAPLFREGAGLLIVGILDDIIRLGVMMVAPLMMALLLSDMLLGLVARAAPNMHVFDLSLAVKNLVLVVLFVLYATFLARYMADALTHVPTAPALLERLANRPAGG